MDATGQYWAAVAIGVALGVAACVTARRHPGPVAAAVGRCIAVVLAADAIVFVMRPLVAGDWSARSPRPTPASSRSPTGYLLSAAGVAIVLFAVLDAPFRFRDRPPHRTHVSRT